MSLLQYSLHFGCYCNFVHVQVSDAKDGCALPTRQFMELINRPVTATDNDMMGTESENDPTKESSRLTSNEKSTHKATENLIFFLF